PVPRSLHSFPTRRSSDLVLHEVVVVADQNADTAAVRRVEDRVSVAGRKKLANKHVQLTMTRPAAVGHRDDVAIIELAIFAMPDGDRKSTRLNSSHVAISY